MAIGGLALCSIQGCSGGKEGDPNGKTVTGTVTYNGSPVEGANVTFMSANSSAFGLTNAEGKYQLTTASGEKVSLGDYQVSIVKKEAPPPSAASTNEAEYVPPDPNAPPAPAPKDLLPAKYADAAKSGLTANVTADGENKFDFALTD
jgi:hypothetical protein